MSKLIQAINVMVANEAKIDRVSSGYENSDEIFFVYDKKHVWSTLKQGNQIEMWYYPEMSSEYEKLLSFKGHEWEGINIVPYSDEEFAPREARESVQELCRVIAEKRYGMDGIFADILNSDES